MRVCQVIDRLTGGGQERVATDIACGLVGAVAESGLLATRAGGEYEAVVSDCGVSLYVASRARRLAPLQWLKMSRWLRERDFDLLHTHSAGSLAAAIRLRRMVGSRYRLVAHVQALPEPERTEFRSFAERWYRRALPHVDAAIVTNEGLRRFLVDECGYSLSAVSIVMNPVDFTRWTPRARDGTPISPMRSRVAMVAGWRRPKDHLTVIRAARHLVDGGRDVEWSLIGEEDGELAPRAEALIRELRLEHVVRILGRRDDIPELLAETDVGVLATGSEGLPVAVLEYCAAGIPSVVSKVEGTETVIGAEHGVVGVVPGDPVALASAVSALLDDEAERRRLGDAAREWAYARAERSVVLQRLTRLYAEVVSAGARRRELKAPTNP